ncbi:hypothetical protein AF72_08740 [Xylella taiwanensis]|uniref:Uncharacterized protein n=1 Tax=Xylella taiwanensis TaxID=1444770 RepID=Z9JHH4_9GAMM|nr:hypothetical protein AF72_08740 [Xylella taiwanensis]
MSLWHGQIAANQDMNQHPYTNKITGDHDFSPTIMMMR